MTGDTKPTVVFSAAPHERVKFANFFGSEGPIKILENPQTLRSAGWDMGAGSEARIVDGEFLQIGYPDWKLIRLYEDGTLTAFVAADGDFLGWGRRKEHFWDDPKLNPLATVEFVFSFARTYARLLKFLKPQPQTVQLGFNIDGAINAGDTAVYLTPGSVATNSYQYAMVKYMAQNYEGQKRIDVPCDELAARPERAAFQILERFYAWFGAPSDCIPYATGTPDGRVIDAEQIVAAGRS